MATFVTDANTGGIDGGVSDNQHPVDAPDQDGIPAGPLRRGWTTGSCAAAAAKAAYTALLTGEFPDPVEIPLPRGGRTGFTLAQTRLQAGAASAGIIKDAGDDPDVTHGALVIATIRARPAGSGLRFEAGEGVGTVTRPGLALQPGEPAINPVPRAMIAAALAEVSGAPLDLEVEIAIPGGETLAERTLNGRLGILGGLSVLGTTGIVIPYSCSSWIHSIHRGIDVARATGLQHVAGSTGSTSEAAVRALYGLPEPALLEMGDFVGGMLKYLKAHPVDRVTIAGGIGKMAKLGQGLLDLHSKRGSVDLDHLALLAAAAGGSGVLAARIRTANVAAEAFALATAEGVDLGKAIAEAALTTAAKAVAGAPIRLDVVVFDRQGRLVGRAG
ncbi:MAG TPA: cobalt-precorrin-5B (C(1))-methyltransferase [Kaistia sp.]|nr:cobalt-precorrin-5B (C(1))-methyltransferase [Kaistia sp.]